VSREPALISHAFRLFLRHPVRVDDLPITGVIELKGNKKIGAEANAYVLTIPLDPLRLDAYTTRLLASSHCFGSTVHHCM
jgi:hypothetical protein